jgi:hypothetical protein
LAIDGPAGVTAIETRVAAVTFNVVDPATLPEVAVMVVVPTPVAVASPALEIVATPAAEDVHVAVLVRFCVLPSL